MTNNFRADADWALPLDNGLIVAATERPDSPVLGAFFEGYDRAFVLPDEREELDGFRQCLALNPVSRHRFGRTHRELVLTVRASRQGPILGGANFLATEIDAPRDHPPVAVALNYLFVEASARGRGLSRKIVQAVSRLAMRAVDADERQTPAIFIEQNDPLRLTDAEYRADTEYAGIDQIDRLAIWAKQGARLVDFPYVQPALSAGQESDDSLVYAALAFPGDRIAPSYLHDHLQSFFGISVLKGGNPDADPAAAPQLLMLRQMAEQYESVALIDLDTSLDRLRALPIRPRGCSMLAFAKTGQVR